ncbi:C4-dicarboxylate TRAP transporter substrate-binding protein [Mameliella sediminis]|uniref:C4-dicarboxylate TRAP transporter substrate-binding protein n=1 Tax=Mameliella sediminis TaxID=2836866 RepID=UPI001C4809FE|nr:C4-dicarboxylate TRAP transporter substrate-binding protein [Mameliella sediminis]MBV7396587.1 C4-dicarboxylate TRAP transporter substrate-binding protein [Mameliella sediminis]MBY6162876.1 C4-dicarboxylate TRAP transporter substrate-binding protein [Mameliella alba]MBY6171140.1 C4-dicarboxylate TRAP transporter substrate-binding protein [Mameliella alba]MBY6176364.1 C4-dicarboxylate TRAP transporter substrate-binding protein [Mameliella alba]
MTFTKLATTSAMAILMGGAALAQQSITVNIGSSHPEANIWVYAMKNTFQPEVNRILAENGDEYTVNWVESYAGTLYKFTDTREAVMDGIVDVGMVGTVWEGANMPLQNVTYFTPFATEDHRMIIEIFDDLSQNLPELKDSWAKNGMVHLSSLITDSYDIYGTFPVNTMADLQNRKLNAPGTSANWLRDTGATPVDGALTTYYTNIQTGVTEGTLSFASGILPTRVYEVAPELTRVGIGSMYFGGIAANKDFFDGLPAPVQDAFRQAAQATSKAHGDYVADLAARALDEMQAAGLTIHQLSDEEKAKWVAGLPNIIEPWLEQTGDAGKVVLKAYFDALEERGAKPLRNWAEGL